MSNSEFLPVEQQLALLSRGSVDLINSEQFARKLEASRKSGQPLTIKAGFDPSTADLHLGHTVLLRKMKHFQDLGHSVVFLVGDFTARIGDPTGKKATRPQLTAQEVLTNARTYEEQVVRILDREQTTIDYNSRWLDELGSEGLIRLAGRYTLARMMERDDFRTRFAANQPISIHELLYPLVQGYDSIAMKADVELGGHDQIFNLLVGRQLMKEEGMEPQVVLTVPLLVGTDGVDKMSKSLGNAIGLTDPPAEVYGKTMSISDQQMWDWWLLLTDLQEVEIEALKDRVSEGDLHPMDAKRQLAQTLTADLHGDSVADQAAREFGEVFSDGGIPEDIPQVSIVPMQLFKALTFAGLASSNKEAQRLVQQGAVSIDGERAQDPRVELPDNLSGYVVKVGKRRFVKVVVDSAF